MIIRQLNAYVGLQPHRRWSWSVLFRVHPSYPTRQYVAAIIFTLSLEKSQFVQDRRVSSRDWAGRLTRSVGGKIYILPLWNQRVGVWAASVEKWRRFDGPARFQFT